MITLVIPTFNRSDFLIRSLQYYADTNYKYKICIGDSSDSFHVDRAKRAIEGLKDKLDITYIEYPGVCIADCIQRLSNQVDTPYTVFIADDDFLVPKSLKRCIKFLEEHPDYSAAHGKAAVFSLQSSEGAHGEFRNVGEYTQRAIEGETASERLLDHLASYSVMLFSVHRTDIWQKLFKNVMGAKDRALMEEILPCCLSVVYGKIKQFDQLHLMRQCHEQRAFHQDVYDLITSPNWFPSYKIFHDSLIEVLIGQDGIQEGRAHDVVKEAFWFYIGDILQSKFKKSYGASRRAQMKRWLKKSFAHPFCLDALKSKTLLEKMSLSSLLNRSSIYHEDFIPIYEAVLQRKKSAAAVVATKENSQHSICRWLQLTAPESVSHLWMSQQEQYHLWVH